VEKLERVVKVYRFELLRLDDMFVRAAYYINGQPVHEDYAVRPSRPSWFPEGSSGQRISQALVFMERWCYRCRHDSAPDDFCPIVATTMAFDIDDPEYPSEWVQNEDGIGGYCTAFKDATDE